MRLFKFNLAKNILFYLPWQLFILLVFLAHMLVSLHDYKTSNVSSIIITITIRHYRECKPYGLLIIMFVQLYIQIWGLGLQ